MSPAFNAEESRIRAAYARRRADARYSTFDAGQLFLLQDRERQALAMLRQRGWSSVEGRSVLDVGCGTGLWLRMLLQWGARPSDLTGIDLLPGRIAAARTMCPPGVALHCGSATSLPFSAGEFELVIQSTVFSSILDLGVQWAIGREMVRVLSPGGLILWYDLRIDNPSNPSVRGVRARRIRELFPDCAIQLRSITLAPPIARRLARSAWPVCIGLNLLPMLRTHWLGLFKTLDR